MLSRALYFLSDAFALAAAGRKDGSLPLVADARHAAGEEALTCSIGAIRLGNQCRFVKTPLLPMCIG
jgi:hypothetical protein